MAIDEPVQPLKCSNDTCISRDKGESVVHNAGGRWAAE